jgi:hypothetical protein
VGISAAARDYRRLFFPRPVLTMTNPLVNSRPSLEGIKSTPSSHDGIPLDVEELLRCYGTSLIQSCGILLKL